MILDIALTYAAMLFAVAIRPSLRSLPGLVEVPDISFDSPLYIIVPCIWVLTFFFFSVYDPKHRYRVTDEMQQLILAVGFSALVFAGVLYIGFREVSRYMFAIFVISDIILLVGWRVIFRWLFRLFGQTSNDRKALIVGGGAAGHQVYDMMMGYAAAGLQVVGYIGDRSNESGHEGWQTANLPIRGNIEDVPRLVTEHEIDDVVIALPRNAYENMSRLVHSLHELPVNVRIVPDYFSLALFRATAEEFAGVPMINLREPALNEVQRLTKRVVDVICASILLILVSPLMLLIALLIKLDSNGPIFFKQKRVGENGRTFGMYKFRSMVQDADKLLNQVMKRDGEGNLVYKFKDDPRVTKIGKFIRRTSIDELPQLINVFMGEMSLVGPRPEMPWMVETYEPWQLKRLSVPQGITGWWQVNGRSDKPMHLHTEEDLYYIQNYSLWMDIYILLKTPWVIMRGKGAY
ncbi:MAG: sugar transferase [Chloroflexota bacterium]